MKFVVVVAQERLQKVSGMTRDEARAVLLKRLEDDVKQEAALMIKRVEEEAKERKHGGRVHGHKGKHRTHKARGGGVGSDKHPFSSAFTASTEAK